LFKTNDIVVFMWLLNVKNCSDLICQACKLRQAWVLS